MLRLEGRVAARWENRATPFRRYQHFLSLGLAGSCLPHPSPMHQFQHSCCSFCHLNSNPIFEIDGRFCPWQHNVSFAQCPAGSVYIIIMRCLGGPWLMLFLDSNPPFHTNFCSLTCRHYLFKKWKQSLQLGRHFDFQNPKRTLSLFSWKTELKRFSIKKNNIQLIKKKKKCFPGSYTVSWWHERIITSLNALSPPKQCFPNFSPDFTPSPITYFMT